MCLQPQATAFLCSGPGTPLCLLCQASLFCSLKPAWFCQHGVAAAGAVGIARAAGSVQRTSMEFCAAGGNAELQREELSGLEPSRCGVCADRRWVLFPSPCSSDWAHLLAYHVKGEQVKHTPMRSWVSHIWKTCKPIDLPLVPENKPLLVILVFINLSTVVF